MTLLFPSSPFILQKDFEESKVALDKSKEEYSTLKVRVKQVAGELKERRAECRTLASEVKVLNANNVILQDQITQMQGESMDMNQNSVETQKMLNDLKAQLIDKENKLYEAREAIDAEAKKGEDALSSYKKRAQQSLAVANARAASAVQAREEAEMEARAARTTSNSAMERVLIAEQRGKDAQAKAKLDVSGMERELQKLTDVKDALEKAQAELGHVQSEAKNLTETNSKLTCELLSVSGQLEASQKSTEDAQEELSDSQSQSRELFEETERLRGAGRMLKDEIQRLRTSYESKELEEKKEAVEIAQQVERNSEAEATIAMLQRELQDANIAIKELKETVKATVEEAEAAASGNSDARPISQSSVMNEDGSAGGMPLFYAMEKQAELSQARDEIARLANLLGDSEADKQDAKDAMLSMERKMNEAMSKLKRQEQSEKLSPTEERVNLEYLKNVFLSFLNANTPTEKKALLPVIGTILCLTPEEENNALTGLNNNGHVMESVTSSVLRFGGWS
jgi:chromosome segregation ATPase